MTKKTAVIAGGGVAGLTAAIELLTTTDIEPIIFEMTDSIGGISKTINYKGNRMDIGGHRFFSKSDRIMNWWEQILPADEARDSIDDKIMLVRHRISRIYYLKKFFDYPIKLNWNTIRNLGLLRMIKIGFSYLKSMVMPIKPEESLEDFFINRFGKELYQTFFMDYTEKVWGVPCSQIKPEWGAQRIKGISIKEVIKHALKSIFIKQSNSDINQKDTETSLIGQFLYPKYGVGQMWDEVGQRVTALGGTIHLNSKVEKLVMENDIARSVHVRNQLTNEVEVIDCDYFLSTMPIKDLVQAMGSGVPDEVHKIACSLSYRDFISVGVLLSNFSLGNTGENKESYKIPDNWIYVQENSVKMGRIQIFNNWSPYMVLNQDNIWIGLEYFCDEDDEFWSLSDKEISSFAVGELLSMHAIDKSDVLDSTVVRMPKAYPSYIGAYDDFDCVKAYLDKMENLYLMGRNGMHRYNNMDHSMLTALEVIDNIRTGRTDKSNIWQVNAENEYHEEKKEE
ncbi:MULTISPECIES: NAD(P)/FAD-dependent oxidoreductase [unclassified Fusibacter]|uniref:NAD(P)/FAD-dependent oxidoreductase n=1 Tax=unclassified Fusibacter TaxID=2624464 RepID=UPI001010250F|nr:MULTISPECIES: NAD(P)/FAD-dependent oxidoreductase [unclassified Fusibacter]MCK8060015.1 NAD(P)/FAD-dependent oxidoreductase [Fusibacter sp. A2]NPE22155.1 NAD(P)/FAD-dependent oxidoreductase [Fusibacter sp. A1]RXV60932.1 hypothetical protein DWB64_09940 [Fusibacter sp. A1]